MVSSVTQATAAPSHRLAETTPTSSQSSASSPTSEPTPSTHRFTLTVTSPPAEAGAEREQEQGPGGRQGQSCAEPEEPPRPQAGPLPRKRGEIGFVEGVHDRGDVPAQASASVASLPAHHPADRDAPPSIDAPSAPASGSGAGAGASASSSSSGTDAAPRSPSPNGSTDTAGKRSFISLLKPRRIPTYGGLRLTSLAIFLLQLCLFAGTVAGWALLSIHMQKSGSSAPPSAPPPDAGPNTDNAATAALSQTSAQIFIHVAFGLTSLAELVFLERSVFRLRAERYAHQHPGEILPRTGGGRASPEGGGSTAMAFAPWNRPPLPTYAAALAQSGVGTGDVEDNIIAIPPPPAYGHTRGSTLLLAGFMSEALRAQRPRDSTGSAASGASRVRSWFGGARGQQGDEEAGDRPKSYMSTDPEWEELRDASTALQLEETLARLEEGGGRPGSR